MGVKLSIITINRNNAEGLRKTIESVVSQNFTDFEYIVIDGASTDNSVEIITEYADRFTYWVSEPDKGIYNAMNKGILKATGEYLLFLNSGDWLVDENVVCDFFISNLQDDIISGNILIYDNINYLPFRSPNKTEISLVNISLPHPGSFIKRELFKKHGLYNETNKIVSDGEFFIKTLILNNCSYNHYERTIACFCLGGISSQQEWKVVKESETAKLMQSFLPPLVYKAFKQITDENVILKEHEIQYREYMNLINGKASIAIKFFLWIKAFKKKLHS